MDVYRNLAVDLAKRAGEIILESFTLGMQKEWKKDNTPLTVTDKTINDLVVTTIRNKFPDHGIVGEEGSFLQHESEYVWVCDPIDGTIPFSHGIPTSTFSLALTLNGNSILGVVYDPYMNRLFNAEKGKGAFLNDKEIEVSQINDIAHTVIDLASIKPAQFDINALELPANSGTHFVSLKSSVYSSMLVACGEFSGAIYAAKYPWDAAAVKIIVEEAGGKVTDLYGNEQRYDQQINGFIASNGLVHDQILALIRSSIKTA